MTTYTYSEQVQQEVERAIRDAIPARIRVQKATLSEDFGGVDLHYTINGKCDLQVRSRFNRPAYAADIDVTFRTTEPRMIEAGTYAPLMLFLWFQGAYMVAGKLVDVYRMAGKLAPPLGERPRNPNGDGTAFHVVTISELHQSRALLRVGDRQSWATACLGGAERLHRIIDGAKS